MITWLRASTVNTRNKLSHCMSMHSYYPSIKNQDLQKIFIVAISCLFYYQKLIVILKKDGKKEEPEDGRAMVFLSIYGSVPVLPDVSARAWRIVSKVLDILTWRTCCPFSLMFSASVPCLLECIIFTRILDNRLPLLQHFLLGVLWKPVAWLFLSNW